MSDLQSPSADPVIDEVRRHNYRWKNSDYQQKSVVHVGGGNLYTIGFKGEDGDWRENYVFERGNNRKAYSHLPEMLLDKSSGYSTSLTSPEFIKLMVVSVLTFMFGIPVVYLVIADPNNKSLQVLTGLLGLTLGYFVGKSDSPK